MVNEPLARVTRARDAIEQLEPSDPRREVFAPAHKTFLKRMILDMTKMQTTLSTKRLPENTAYRLLRTIPLKTIAELEQFVMDALA